MKEFVGALAFAVAVSAGTDCAMAQDAVPAPAWPDPQCTQPDLNSIKPPMSNNDSAAVSIYNAKVKSFNTQAKAYNICINAYVESSNLESKRIHDQASIDQKRLAENANASMKTVQDKMQKALADARAISAAQENGTTARKK